MLELRRAWCGPADRESRRTSLPIVCGPCQRTWQNLGATGDGMHASDCHAAHACFAPAAWRPRGSCRVRRLDRDPARPVAWPTGVGLCVALGNVAADARSSKAIPVLRLQAVPVAFAHPSMSKTCCHVIHTGTATACNGYHSLSVSSPHLLTRQAHCYLVNCKPCPPVGT